MRYHTWEQVLALAWSPDGTTLAAAAGENIFLLDVAGFSQQSALPAGVWSSGLAYHPTGRYLASAGRDGLVSIWDTQAGRLATAIQAHKKGANCVAFSPDGNVLASGGNDGMLRLWDALSGQPAGQIIGGTYSIPYLAYARDGASIAIANGEVIRFRDTTTLRFVQTMRGEASFFSLDISPNGEKMATGDSAASVQVWDIGSGERLLSLKLETAAGSRTNSLVWQVAFDPGGQTLAAAAGDGAIWLWDAASGERLARLPAHSLAATSVAFSPDGRWLATGGLDGVVRLWELP
jgi:WD40 repeat protein